MRAEDENASAFSWGKMLGILALLLLAAGVFSYLWAYALSDAMVAGHLNAPVDGDADSRLEQMEHAFGILTAIFLFIAAFMKFSSIRQIRRIDAMNKE